MESRTVGKAEVGYKRVMILIPAYNAGPCVGRVVRDVAALPESPEILVVDDGSTDTTATVAREAGAIVVSHERNLGKGAALRTGFERFLKTGCEAVITLDADGQHCPRETANLIDRWRATGADIVVGSRRRDLGNMPLARVLSNALSSRLVSLSAGTRIPDSQSGFRLLTRRAVENVSISSNGFAAESEFLIKAGLRGFRIESAPVSTIYADERSFINPFKQPVLFMALILRSLSWRFRSIDRTSAK
jgi:glycosyltransferase involved in cell wall biosynthesis